MCRMAATAPARLRQHCPPEIGGNKPREQLLQLSITGTYRNPFWHSYLAINPTIQMPRPLIHSYWQTAIGVINTTIDIVSLALDKAAFCSLIYRCRTRNSVIVVTGYQN